MGSRLLATAAGVAAAALVAGGCGHASTAGTTSAGGLVVRTTTAPQDADATFPAIATKNTTRVAGADPVQDAAAVARAVFPGGPGGRPAAVALVDRHDWRTALAASVLMAAPVHAPLLLADGPSALPPASADALAALHPSGSKAAGDAQLIRIGDVPRPPGYRTTDIDGRDPFALARAIDATQSAARGTTGDRVLVVSADAPQYAAPAAAWAAKSGDSVLFVRRTSLPAETRKAIQAHQQPKIFVLGPSRVISHVVTAQLRKLGTVTRVGGPDPVRNAIAFARELDGDFGWGVVDPGHGLVFARADADPATAAAIAPLSASGTYGPLVLTDGAQTLPKPLADYLATIRPGYSEDPVRGVYNRGWIVGPEAQISVGEQAQVDGLLEIEPVSKAKTDSP